MKLKRITAIIMSALMIAGASAVSAGAADINSTNPYERQAAQYDELAYTGGDLGAVYTPESTTFKVWSPSASDVKLNLYTTGSDEEEGAAKIDTCDMTKEDGTAVWSVTVSRDLKNVYYTYSVTNNGVTEETVDIYAKAVGVNGDRGMIVDLDSTDPEGWENDSFKRVSTKNDANIWEVHIKDFSFDESSGVSEANRGKYLAFTEDNTTLNGKGEVKTGVSYLKDMGYNYVQINPFYDFGSVDETADFNTTFNWGYDPKNYNVPEGSYSSNPYDGNVRINEAKQMIQGLHSQGVGVIMDVVYNHTHTQDSWFQKTVPDYYYRKNADGTWSAGSGCGNDTASEREMYRKYMIESVKYWATEYHVDGFRFDLMGLHDTETMNMIREALDEIDPGIIMYGEGWSMSTPFDTGSVGATQANASLVSPRIGFFNDQIRDGLKGSVFGQTDKGYLQGDTADGKAVSLGLAANTGKGTSWTARTPEQTMSYTTCHDNATLYDRLVYSQGGEFENRYDEYVKQSKLSGAIVFGSQGTPFMIAGEEFARTKFGDENSYSSSININKLNWNRVVEYNDLVTYYKGLMEFRSEFAPVRTTTTLSSDQFTVGYSKAKGTVYSIYKNTGDKWNTVVMMYNDTTEEQVVSLEGKVSANEWVVVVNGDAAGTTKLGEISGTNITVAPQSAMYIVDKASYDASNMPQDKGIVNVEYVNIDTEEVISSYVLSGKIGDTYVTELSNQFDLDYNFIKSTDNTKGTYGVEPITVKYYLQENLLVPADVTGDGEVDLRDILEIQKYMAELVAFDDETFNKADVNKDGSVDLHDILLYQKYLAEMPSLSGVGTVTVNYLDQNGKKIADSTVSKIKVGQSYTVSPAEIGFYTLDETKLPENATGTVKAGNTDVNYYYNFEAITSTVHVKVPDGETWVPNLYSWDDTAGEFLGKWPGKTMTPEGDNWYTIDVPNAGTYNWIVNCDGKQTADMKGYSGDIWVVMESATTVASVSDTDPRV